MSELCIIYILLDHVQFSLWACLYVSLYIWLPSLGPNRNVKLGLYISRMMMQIQYTFCDNNIEKTLLVMVSEFGLRAGPRLN